MANKDCYNCVFFNPTPVFPPCEDWEYCINNDYCDFRPNFLYKIKLLFQRCNNMRLYAARDRNTGKLVSDLTSPGHKFWHRRADCETAIRNYNMSRYKHRNYDLELVVYELVEVVEG